MELKYLHTLKTILDSGNYLKAAERLGYTQSTVTFQMQQLEQELSLQLFEKNRAQDGADPVGTEASQPQRTGEVVNGGLARYGK